MKFLLTLLLAFSIHYTPIWAQSIQISISGLTCSQCSRSVEMQLKKIKSISNIEMDLKNAEAKISLKKHHDINYSDIAQAVYNAGFSIDQFIVNFPKSYINNNDNACIKTNDGNFVILNNSYLDWNKTHFKVKFIGKPFNKEKITINKKQEACEGSKTYYIHLL